MISPIEVSTFQDSYFEKKPLLIARDIPTHFDHLLSIDVINSYLERKDIRYPSVRLVKNGLELPQTDYQIDLPYGSGTFGNLIENDKLFALFSEGATIVFQALHRTIPQLSLFCQNIEQYLKFPLQTNIYLTPRSSQGFAAHFDNHDVFILQTYGSKIWRVYESPVVLPTKAFDKNKWTKTAPQIEVELKAGDTLYIPRGFIHEALTTDNVSMHITLGILTYTWIDVFRLLIDESHSIGAFRKSVKWNELSEAEMKDTVSELMNVLIESTSYSRFRKEFSERFSKKRLTSDHNRLNDLLNISTLTNKTKLEIRKEIIFSFEKNVDEAVLSFYNKLIKFPLYASETIESLLSFSNFRISDLNSNLDEDGKMVLIRKLLKEGFLTIINNASS